MRRCAAGFAKQASTRRGVTPTPTSAPEWSRSSRPPSLSVPGPGRAALRWPAMAIRRAAARIRERLRADSTRRPGDRALAERLAALDPADRVHMVAGPVEETLPDHAPGQLALLRLDTDWYESTRQELEHLYPRLAHGGVLIVDDYGHWAGARRAVDEYFAREAPLLLSRIDYTARIAIKH